MSAEAIAPIGITPFAGVVPWLASLWRTLRASLEDHRATSEEQQVLHLIEYVMSCVGEPVLAAKDPDDLDDRLDELVGSQDFLGSITILFAKHISLFRRSGTTSGSDLASVIRHGFGPPQADIIAGSQQVVDAWMDAQRQASAIVTDVAELSSQAIEFSLVSPEFPAEVVQSIFHGLRASVCSIAIARALVTGASVEPWLATALTERFVESIRQHLRLLASLPGIVIDEAIVPRAQRFDPEAIEARHRRARATAQRSLESARARLGS